MPPSLARATSRRDFAVYDGPLPISTPRWNEVEGTRLFPGVPGCSILLPWQPRRHTVTRVEIDHEGPIAPYLQLAAILREQIRSGKIPVGRRIPSQRYLAQEYDLSHNTVNKAIEVLKAEGLVERAPGRGMFVRAVP